jgi:hypothetical protein
MQRNRRQKSHAWAPLSPDPDQGSQLESTADQLTNKDVNKELSNMKIEVCAVKASSNSSTVPNVSVTAYPTVHPKFGIASGLSFTMYSVLVFTSCRKLS